MANPVVIKHFIKYVKFAVFHNIHNYHHKLSYSFIGKVKVSKYITRLFTHLKIASTITKSQWNDGSHSGLHGLTSSQFQASISNLDSLNDITSGIQN